MSQKPRNRCPIFFTDEERFHTKYVCLTSGCWEWIAHITKSGYGRFRIGDKMPFAHRVSWSYAFGEIPSDLCVCHKCDNPKCVNPGHLFLGTNQDNIQDKVSKNRCHSTRGELNGNTSLNEDQVRTLRNLSGVMSMRDLGRKFGISAQCVFKIVHRKTWNHVQ